MKTKPSKSLQIQVTSDFICPWCLIAERRLKEAAELEGVALEIHYHPFELNPDMPADGLDRKEYRSAKFGSWERSLELDKGTVEAAAQDQVSFAYDKIERTPNTRNAHRLVWLAQETLPEIEADLVERILSAYFEEGMDIGNLEILADLAVEAGFPSLDEAVDFLKSNQGYDELQFQRKVANMLGLRGVPFIEVEGESLRGAPTTTELRTVLRKHATQFEKSS